MAPKRRHRGKNKVDHRDTERETKRKKTGPSLPIANVHIDSEKSTVWKDFGLPSGKEQPVLARTELVGRIIKRLKDRDNLYVVRGPPQCGKTSLMKLIQEKLGADNCMTLLPNFYCKTGASSFLEELGDAVSQKDYDYVLLDEAQRLYPETEFGSIFKTFWDNTARVIQEGNMNVKLLCFAVYGAQFTASSPLTWKGTTWQEMMISKDETRRYIEQFRGTHERVTIDENDISTIYHYTGGHIGYISAICDGLRFLEPSENVAGYLRSSKCYQRLSTQRASDVIKKLTREQKSLVINLIKQRGMIREEVFLKLESNGLVEKSDNGVMRFTSKILELLSMSYVFSDRLDRQPKDNLSVFLTHTFWNMPNMKFYNRRSDGRILERDICISFYESSFAFLLEDKHCIIDYGKGFEAVDFFVNGWGIELLRKGNKLKEHWERFRRPSGRYAGINWKEAAVVEIYQVQDMDGEWPKLDLSNGVMYVRVYFDHDFNSVKVCFTDADRKNEFIPIIRPVGSSQYESRRYVSDTGNVQTGVVNPLFENMEQLVDEEWMNKVFRDKTVEKIRNWVEVLSNYEICRVEDLKALRMDRTYNELRDANIPDAVLLKLRDNYPQSI